MNNLYLIIEEKEELIDFHIYNILKDIDYSEDDKIVYDMGINTLKDIIDEASMISIFSGKKLIIGNNLRLDKISDSEIELLNKYLDNKNPLSTIILSTNKVDSRTKIYKLFKNNFNIVDTSNKEELVNNYIKEYISMNNYKIDNYSLEYLGNKIIPNIYNINNELDKIFLYIDKDKNISKDIIDLLINNKIDDIVYEFTNSILEKDYNKMVKMYQDMKREGLGLDYLIVAISNAIRQSLIIKLLSNQYKSSLEISKVIGKKEFYVKKMQERLYEYSERDLLSYLDKLYNIDKNIKSGKTRIDSLELFLLTN